MDAKSIRVGDIVCDCRYQHLAVVAIDGDDLDLADGSRASAAHCCSPVPHPGWSHPTSAELRAWARSEVAKMTPEEQALLDPAWLAELGDESRPFDSPGIRFRQRP